MKVFTLFLMFLFTSFYSKGQNSMIYGYLERKGDLFPAKGLQVFLLDSANNKIDSCKSDSAGKYLLTKLKPSTYNLMILDTVPRKIVAIVASGNDTIKIDILTFEPCKIDFSDGLCPKCQRKDKVLKKENNVFISRSFTSERAAIRSGRKTNRRGYETYTNEDGEEVVYDIKIKDQEANYENPCNRWFCVRDKLVF